MLFTPVITIGGLQAAGDQPKWRLRPTRVFEEL